MNTEALIARLENWITQAEANRDNADNQPAKTYYEGIIQGYKDVIRLID